MYIKVFQIFTLVVFVLLQAAAPLVHAHIGLPHSGGIHMHITLLASLGASTAEFFQGVRLADSPAIEVGDANKKRYSETLDAPVPAMITGAGHAPLVGARDEPQVLGHSIAFQRLSRFTHPPAHAPPNSAT